MSNNSPAWLPKAELEFIQWTQNFITRLTATHAMYAIDENEILLLSQRHTQHKDLLAQSDTLTAWSKYLTAARRQLTDGAENGTIIISARTATPEQTVQTGLRRQIIRLADLIKKTGIYTPAQGKELGIEAEARTPVDWSKQRPELRAEIIGGVLVRVHWKKGPAEAIRLEVNRGAGWGPLTDDLRSPYDDPASLPETPTLWRYRGTYLYKDQRVGATSEEIVIPVQGA